MHLSVYLEKFELQENSMFTKALNILINVLLFSFTKNAHEC